MSYQPLVDEYVPEDLDGQDFSESFENGEIWGARIAVGGRKGMEENEHPFSLLMRSGGYGMESWELVPDVPNKYGLKQEARWMCQACSVNLRGNSHLLQIHHPGRDKTTNDPKDMMLVCLKCHAHMPEHAFMLNKYDSALFSEIDRLRSEQGLSKGPLETRSPGNR
jgi:hypothetical protein